MLRESLANIVMFVENILRQSGESALIANEYTRSGGKITPRSVEQIEIIAEAGSATESDIKNALAQMRVNEFLKKKINRKG